MLSTVLLILLILFLVGGLPTWSHSRAWGYGPAGIIGTVLLIYVILILIGTIPVSFYHYGPP
ncbi:MAG: DUF3309 domain-containing protein [Legionella sp.]|nr:MAG: DUF3309 domain-containing protein [Legionella sp.]